jgi:hypothetical protein
MSNLLQKFGFVYITIIQKSAAVGCFWIDSLKEGGVFGGAF